ncbi:uncharacterized protein TNCT_269231 [Trichonephila clavata]|uniref:Neugrin n=1 Tax=Trichonephila clavata TaxID=2740835 RepID=A0A8X6KCQ0_TRICU|nr:uncharacterized protein TNCT_269231 [Trichonephila clavata]
MIFRFLNINSVSYKVNLPFTAFRYVRNVRRRQEGPKLIKGQVKTLAEFNTDDFVDVKDFRDLVGKVKTDEKFNEVTIEEAFTKEDDFGKAIARSVLHRDAARKSKDHKSFVKKQIIQKKFFKFEVETNLLTYAAKQQIRYLNQLNPEEWNPETISQCFPITVQGVKKLLKSNFELRSPEKIKEHDAEVERRWEILKSGQHSDSITFCTQRMWDEGKIIKENYRGNPNFPNESIKEKKIIKEGKKVIGEYSAIIQQYIDYKKEKDAKNKLTYTNSELQVKDDSKNSLNNKKSKKPVTMLNMKKYYIDDEKEVKNVDMFATKRAVKFRSVEETDIQHNQFKLNLKEEISHKSELDSKYDKWIQKQSVVDDKPQIPVKSANIKEMFTKVPKFSKDNIELKGENSSNGKQFYIYDDKHGYQYPAGKNVKRKITIPAKLRKEGNIYKIGQCVYDEDGELLYKIPQ